MMKRDGYHPTRSAQLQEPALANFTESRLPPLAAAFLCNSSHCQLLAKAVQGARQLCGLALSVSPQLRAPFEFGKGGPWGFSF